MVPVAPPKVLIVGAGPAGFVLAISLLQNGVPVRIIDKRVDPRLGQRGAGLMPRTLELFTTIRIIDQVLKRAIPVPRVRKYDSANPSELVEEFDMHPPPDPSPSNPYLVPVMLGQDRLEKIFWHALADLGCAAELGTELMSFTQFDSHVEVKLRKSGMEPDAQSVNELASFEYMIGTDGAKGVVRKQLGLSFVGETLKVENLVVGDIKVDGLSPKYWHRWGDAASVMVSLRGTEEPDLFNFVIMGININYAEIANDPVRLRQVFAKTTGMPIDQFKETPWISLYTPNIRMVDKFGIGRVLIAGDAGHVQSPTGGQGVNTRIQDSFNLGWKLALVLKRFAPPSLLQTCTEERLPVVAEMLKQTTKILKATFAESTEKPLNRSFLQLEINYRWSSIVLDECQSLGHRNQAEHHTLIADKEELENPKIDINAYGNCFDGDLRAGDRAPGAPGLVDRSSLPLVLTTYSLFRVFGSHYHTVLIFHDLTEPKPFLELIQVYPPGTVRSVVILPRGKSVPLLETVSADVVLEDVDGYAHDTYVPTGTCGVVIVRPDGIVGAIVKDRGWLHKYFLGIFAGETRKRVESSS